MGNALTSFPPHFLTLESITTEQFEALFELTRRLRGEETDHLENDRLALVFEKPSTRTRVSFEVGIDQLGGTAIYLSKDDIQLSRGESIPDTSRTLSRYVDGIVCRTFGHDRVKSLAEWSEGPVVNALTDWVHPCQALADFFTIRENSDGTPRLAYVGDGNNVCHSLMIGAFLLDVPMTIAGPKGYEPDETLLESLSDRGASIEWTTEPEEAVDGVDFVYTDVWASMGQEAEAEKRKQVFQPYQVNEDLLTGAADDARVLHCLPAHRGEEITDSVIDGPKSLVFDQAENRLHVQKALLAALLSDGDLLK
jgi:ornithine carbamoyltransferase